MYFVVIERKKKKKKKWYDQNFRSVLWKKMCKERKTFLQQRIVVITN